MSTSAEEVKDVLAALYSALGSGPAEARAAVESFGAAYGVDVDDVYVSGQEYARTSVAATAALGAEIHPAQRELYALWMAVGMGYGVVAGLMIADQRERRGEA